MAKVTVCIPTYNRVVELRKTLGAVLDQSYRDFDVLVCNDGSTDGTREYLDTLCLPKIQVLHNEQNRNLPITMSRLFLESTGKYIAVHHDHDPTEPHWLEAMVRLMESHPEAGMACCGCYQRASNGERLAGQDQALYDLFRGAEVLPGSTLVATLATRVHTPLAATASLFRRETVERIAGYLADWFLAADEDLYRRIASVSDVAFCSQRLYTLSPRPTESAQQVGGWRSVYTLSEFRKDTTRNYWHASWRTRQWNLCRLSLLKTDALLGESLSAWLRGNRDGLALALAWNRVPPLPTGRPPLPLWARGAFRLWIATLSASAPLGVALGTFRHRLKGHA